MHTSSSPSTPTTYTGRVDFVSSHHAFIVVEGLDKDLSVPSIHLQGAMHGDMVKVRVLPQRRRGRQEGRVVEIVERKHTKVVGCIIEQEGRRVCLPDHKRLHHVIRLVDGDEVFDVNDKVVVRLTAYPTARRQAVGRVTRVLGAKGSHEAEVNAILEEYDLSHDFPAEVQEEVGRFGDELSEEEMARRRDFTGIPTFTIDPVDAKDFDDALSIRRLDSGDYEVGVHIADVSHYVREGGAIDEEALRRGTSVYLVGTCVPMLPERLANDLCSLRPEVRRPAFSIVVRLDEEARVKGIWVGETVIYSAKRFTYEEAKEVLDAGEGRLYRELSWLHGLARRLRGRRLDEGAIAFESTDVSIRLDEEGQPIDVVGKRSSETNQLVEEFMLLANRLIAEKMYGVRKTSRVSTFMYRMHDDPSVEKLEEFAVQVRQLGYSFVPTAKDLGRAFNKLLKTVEGTAHETIIHMLAIRTMAQACYTPEPKGHFGLGYRHYTHFTSPIRRYPDLVVHRLVKAYLSEGASLNRSVYDGIATHTSSRERLAIEAERASIQGKQVLYMKRLEGRVYKGIVCGITAWGMYVQLMENRCEGMVKVSGLRDDFYEFDKRSFSLVGKRSKKTYKLGDVVLVRIKYCDLERRTTDLVLVD